MSENESTGVWAAGPGCQTSTTRGTVTQLLARIESGEPAAMGQLMETVMAELRQLADGMMRRERTSHTLQPTALVNEAAIRILASPASLNARSRSYFFGAMAQAMRRVLVDHARRVRARRRGGQWNRQPDFAAVEFADPKRSDLVELDDLLKKLASANRRQAEIVTRRIFGGFSMPEIAEQLAVSLSTVEKDWRFAHAWLRSKLSSSENR